jgi:plastocyanin
MSQRHHGRAALLTLPLLLLAACSGGGSTTQSIAGDSNGPSASTTASAPASHGTARAAHTPRATPSSATNVGSRSATTSPSAHHSQPASRHTTSSTHPPSSPAANVYVIHARDYEFRPANPSVHVGTTVKVVNDGPSPHTWTSGNAPVHKGPFDSGNLDQGQTYTYTFNKAGSYNFFCRYHYSSGMKGRVTVT